MSAICEGTAGIMVGLKNRASPVNSSTSPAKRYRCTIGESPQHGANKSVCVRQRQVGQYHIALAASEHALAAPCAGAQGFGCESYDLGAARGARCKEEEALLLRPCLSCARTRRAESRGQSGGFSSLGGKLVKALPEHAGRRL